MVARRTDGAATRLRYLRACADPGYDRSEAVTPTRRTDLDSKLIIFIRRPVSQMRELERDFSSDIPACERLAIVGPGRVGTAFATALRRAGYEIIGPLGRGATGRGANAVLLCVPDGEIAGAAAQIAPGPLVGHCSGATGLGAAGAARGVLAASADDGHRARRGFRRRRRGDRRQHAAGAGVGRRAGARASDAARRDRRRGPRRLPRRRVDRLELPGHARGRGRAARRRRRPAARAARAARARHGRELGPPRTRRAR